MPDNPPSNVKIYDRPERKGPSPLLLVVAVLIVLLIGLFVYRALHHPAPQGNVPPGLFSAQITCLPEAVDRIPVS